jgi:hypothetical protein
MSDMDAIRLIRALAARERALRGREFLAPLRRDCRARVRIQELIYELIVAGAQPGWWICRVCDGHSAEVVAEALAWQRGEYLALWPVLRMVLLEPLAGRDWLALPYNPAAAMQRFGFAGPHIVSLVEGGQPCERIIARVEGATLWYDAPDRRADPQIAEQLRAALSEECAEPDVAHLGAGERAAYELLLAARHQAHIAIEERRLAGELRAALTITGARLLGYERVGAQVRVFWEREGARNVTLVDPDLTVAAAGICLSGQDRRFDLTSIVGVVRDAPDYARYLGDEEE